MNPKSVFKKECKGFTKVSNALVVKSKLSVSAIGIMVKLLSYQDFAIHKETEQRSSKLGEKSFNKAWQELVDAGFIKSEPINNGKWAWRYTIINDPSLTDEARDEIKSEAVNQRRNTSPVKSGTQNQTRKTTADKRVGNTDTTNTNRSNIDKSNIDKSNTDRSSQESVEEVINEQVQNNIISVEESSIISDSKVNLGNEIIQSNKNQDWVRSNVGTCNIQGFIYFEDVVKIYDDNFLDEIDFRKHLFLSYWYNRIDSTHLTPFGFELYNNYFKVVSDLFRYCYNYLNLKLQPNRFLDTPIIDLLTLIKKLSDSNLKEREISNIIFKNLKHDYYMLSRYIDSTVDKEI